MLVEIATWIVIGLQVYVLAGLLFGAAFVSRGIARLDPAAAESGWGFRLLVLPGAVALWPLLLRRWLAGTGAPPAERTAHRVADRGDTGRREPS